MTLRRFALVLATAFALLATGVGIVLTVTSVWDIVLRQFVGLGRLLDIESAAIVGCFAVPVATVLLAARKHRAAAIAYGLAALLWLVGFFATGTSYDLTNLLMLLLVMPVPSLALAALSLIVGRATQNWAADDV